MLHWQLITHDSSKMDTLGKFKQTWVDSFSGIKLHLLSATFSGATNKNFTVEISSMGQCGVYYRLQTKFGARWYYQKCLSFCPQGSLCMMSLPVRLPGPMFLLVGSLFLVPCSFWGFSAWRVSVKEVLCPGGLLDFPLNQKNRQYASYWNAFLLSKHERST